MTRRRTISPAWAAAKVARAARRAIDPQVQARRATHEQRQAKAAAKAREDAA